MCTFIKVHKNTQDQRRILPDTHLLLQEFHRIAGVLHPRIICWTRWRHRCFRAADCCQCAGDVGRCVQSAKQGLGDLKSGRQKLLH